MTGGALCESGSKRSLCVLATYYTHLQAHQITPHVMIGDLTDTVCTCQKSDE